MFIFLFLLRRFLCKTGNFHTGACRKFVERFFKIDILALHHKLKDIATLIALTKTTPLARIGPNDECRRFLIVVKWAETCVVLACVTQFYSCLRNKVNNIYA